MRGPDKPSTNRAGSLRRRSTQAEMVLWLALRDRRLGGCKFARQQHIDRYYVDFVCREQRLIIEVDGSQHIDSIADKHREERLRELGYKIVRVWNNDVLGNLDAVLELLLSELAPAPHPVPLPAGGERVRSVNDSPSSETDNASRTIESGQRHRRISPSLRPRGEGPG